VEVVYLGDLSELDINLVNQCYLLEVDLGMVGKVLKANIAIHTCATVSAIAAGAWASIPIVGAAGIILGADTLFLTPMTIGMVIYIGKLHGQTFTYSSIMAGVGQVIGMALGVTAARALTALLPGWGTGVNAVLAAGLQETIGWGAYMLLEEGGDINELGDFIKNRRDDIDAKQQQESKNAENIKRAIDNLPEDKRRRYNYLEEQMKKNISDSAKAGCQEEMIQIIDEAMS